MKLHEYINVAKLKQYVAEGYVRESYHDEFPLVQFTYDRKAVYENLWDDVTTKTRGLIVDMSKAGEIIARPFEKFFNYETGYRPETHLENLPESQPFVTEKMDGSLGILYSYKGVDYLASKASFRSDHAIAGTKWYHQHVGLKGNWPEGYTPVFEMVFPSVQRIVVDYNFEGLVLLALINNKTGEEIHAKEYWANFNGVRPVRTHNLSFWDCRHQIINGEPEATNNREGYVVAWPRSGQPPLRVKVKFSEYLRLHRLVTGCTPKHIWECLSNDNDTSIGELLKDSVPWFAEFATEWASKLMNEYLLHRQTAESIYDRGLNMGFTNRKEWALYFTSPENKRYSAVLFHLLDNKPEAARQAVWKMVKPLTKAESPLITEV